MLPASNVYRYSSKSVTGDYIDDVLIEVSYFIHVMSVRAVKYYSDSWEPKM